jgi:protoporphyrinogen oxidase
MKAKVAVLGGGVAGVTVANVLAERGVAVDLLEVSSRLGGLHHSVTIDGCCFDIGAFIFTPEHELLRSFPFLARHFRPAQPRYARITPQGNLDVYPMSIESYVREEGLLGAGLGVASLVAGRLRYRRKRDVREYAQYYMGRQIYRRSGLQRYVERLYGLQDTEVGLEFAAQRLRMLERYTPRELLTQQLKQTWQRLRRSPVPGNSRALVRPSQGFSYVYGLVHQQLERVGVEVRLNARLEAIRRLDSGFEVEVDGETRSYDRVISTIPIPTAQKLLGIEPWSGFETMRLYSLFYRGKLRHDNAIQYNFTPRGQWKRITSFSKYYGQQNGRDWWTVEVTTRDNGPNPVELFQREFEDHARDIGVFEGEAEFLGATETENAYPVFRVGYSDQLVQERAKLAAAGIDAIGRQGSFEYLSSLEAASRAKKFGNTLSMSLTSDASEQANATEHLVPDTRV